jgi:pimeloyl-ACP methyl ester carboxylesterase
VNETTLVILPGIDGTDVFLRPLLAALPLFVRPLVVTYPGDVAGGYADLLPLARRAVEGLSAFYVLGWSFGGPLALMLADAEPERTRGVILSATFVRPPRPVLGYLRFAMTGPLIWLYRAGRRLPLRVLKSPDDPWRRAKAETWSRVTAVAFAARMRALASVDARPLLASCRPRTLCLTFSDDRVVPRHNAEEMRRLRPSIRVITIDGEHLAMYTHPEPASRLIADFIRDGG